jgi:hypothetical protein
MADAVVRSFSRSWPNAVDIRRVKGNIEQIGRFAQLRESDNNAVTRHEPERPQHWDGPPHCGEGGRAGQHAAVLPRMKPRQQRRPVNRAVCRTTFGDVGELDDAATVQPPYQRDLSLAQGAIAIKPDKELGHDASDGHGPDYVSARVSGKLA